jgi:TetR/AcrR family acrAB operon transcriptional repressor
VKKTREKALETRDRILNSAEIVFSRQGVARTSLADIATAAEVTRGAIYWHFKNKADLFGAMIDRIQVPMEALFAAAVDPLEPDPLKQLRKIIVMCLRDVAMDDHMHRVFDVLFTKCEYSAQMDQLLERSTAAARGGRHRIASGLGNAVEKNQLPADLDVNRAAAVLHALVGGILREWLLDGSALSLPDEAERIADSALDLVRHSASLRKKQTPLSA